MTDKAPTATQEHDADDALRPKKVRRTQAERTSSSRKRAIDAAILNLAEEGYAATTVMRVAQRAGISRGGILHHFSGKAELMEAVGYRAVETLQVKRKEALRGIAPGVERFQALTRATWETIREPESIALLEILIGSRGDPSMAEIMPRFVQQLDQLQLAKTKTVAKAAGIENERLLQTMNKLHAAAMRGLLLESMFDGSAETIAESIKLLEWYKEKLTERLFAENEGG
ncbi:TetR/AcrR family transcriptional regulator [Erythrobacter litoralis]|uniref:TetR/AcrR family transcriptional regulator n=1 Tax=Erythrobacter litoralis TaxID=39960 RepID=UPI002434B015|nr:TetR/AcrR family transcriptional regulator [Erythrobacter litoralis]MDG6078858.1 TetR/AcrR family transcriptional regulator [Erythrobacter litoralis]